eukprot:2167714-Amphidinium_carterae.1
MRWAFFRGIGSRYVLESKRRPHVVASLSAGCILSFGDIAVQWLEGAATWDRPRSQYPQNHKSHDQTLPNFLPVAALKELEHWRS